MNSFRILHVDDEPDILEVVNLSLRRDREFTIRSCISGETALVEAAEWAPDLILCDVMMPVMDGPATLARLRENPRTARIPLVFMTARAQIRELDHFTSLGASGVIAKPFDPMTLAASVRRHLPTAGLADLNEGFRERLRADRTTLSRCRETLRDESTSSAALDELLSCAHKLAGAAGIFGFHKVSSAAAALEESTTERRSGRRTSGSIESDLDALVDCIGGEELLHSARPQPVEPGLREPQPALHG
jgi:CheY-like chemotaxis protein/HPt (histidine-containing phosphotransfer) domain-containing protein